MILAGFSSSSSIGGAGDCGVKEGAWMDDNGTLFGAPLTACLSVPRGLTGVPPLLRLSPLECIPSLSRDAFLTKYGSQLLSFEG